MIRPNLTQTTGLACLLLTACLGLVCGCSKSEDTASPTSNPAPSTKTDTASTATGGAGQTVFTANCSRCHSINGTGGRMGPDLSHVGAEASNTADALAAFIKNPKSKNPNSRMPAFEGKIPDSDMKALTEYLASLK